LDPIDMARSVLGQATLSMIRRSLADGAQMGIGVCSSTGFYDDGTVFWRNPGAGEGEEGPRLWEGETGADAYRNWSPFGVKEAILFLATGRCAGTVSEYSWREDVVASRRRPIPIRLTKSEGMAASDWRS